MLRPPKILIVDDEPAILASTAALLSEMGYPVVAVARAADILDAVRRERPDLLLQDVRMPGLDLAALVSSLREDPALVELPILLFSAGMDVGEVAARVGATDHIEKPFRPRDLVEAIRGALS